MLTISRCDRCGSPATTHITDASSRPVVSSHFCERHRPNESTLHGRIRRMWNSPQDREAAISFFAQELGMTQDKVRQMLESNLRQLDDLAE